MFTPSYLARITPQLQICHSSISVLLQLSLHWPADRGEPSHSEAMTKLSLGIPPVPETPNNVIHYHKSYSIDLLFTKWPHYRQGSLITGFTSSQKGSPIQDSPQHKKGSLITGFTSSQKGSLITGLYSPHKRQSNYRIHLTTEMQSNYRIILTT